MRKSIFPLYLIILLLVASNDAWAQIQGCVAKIALRQRGL